MNLIPELKIEFADLSMSDEELDDLVQLINRVYVDSEQGMWISNYKRTNNLDFKSLIKKGEIIVARSSDKIVGSICIFPKTDSNIEFRMLVSDPELRGQRIGARLVEFVEEWAPQNAYNVVSLVLITPTQFKLQSKEFLLNWYTRIGYELKYTKKAVDVLPYLEKELATDCDFSVYEKQVC